MTFAPTRVAVAQDQANNPEEINRKYQDALNQLKAAQDRKNELAVENEKLNAKLAEMQKNIDEANRRIARFAEQTFRLRSEHAALRTFLGRYPQLQERWRLFLETDPLAVPAELPEYIGPPLTSPEAVEAPATSQTPHPATQTAPAMQTPPATQPLPATTQAAAAPAHASTRTTP